jgi:hypothetical protein
MLNFDIRQVAATLLHPQYRSLKKIPDYNNYLEGEFVQCVENF